MKRSVIRIGSDSDQGLQNIALVMLAEMGVLQAITARPDSSITASELAKDTGCDELLIRGWFIVDLFQYSMLKTPQSAYYDR